MPFLPAVLPKTSRKLNTQLDSNKTIQDIFISSLCNLMCMCVCYIKYSAGLAEEWQFTSYASDELLDRILCNTTELVSNHSLSTDMSCACPSVAGQRLNKSS